MCNCLSFLLDNPALNQKWVDLVHSLARRIQSWSHSLPSTEVELFRTISEGCMDSSSHVLSHKRITAARAEDGYSDGLLEKCGIHVIRKRRPLVQGANGNNIGYAPAHANDADDANDVRYNQESGSKEQIDAQMNTMPDHNTHAVDDNTKPFNMGPSQAIDIVRKEGPKRMDASFQDYLPRMSPKAIIMSGGDNTVSLFTQQGLKGTNQDSMVVWENFIPSEKATFCGVFDGHGPHGHHISKNVRDKLPAKIASCWQGLQASNSLARRSDSFEKSTASRQNLDPDSISAWEETFHNAFNLMDRDLLIDEDVDCVFSGTTAVTLVKQGNDLIMANVGDSRAVLGVKFEDSVVALQLTVDLTPNLPKEAERIRRCKGRVLALRKEPFVKRVWLPHENTPGLAMARAFGDYILKNFGVISVPEITHRRISKNDKFVVLATDGVWDVLSNEQVVRIVDAAQTRSLAAQLVVDTAVRAWKVKYPDAKVDDCAVVCLFLDSTHPESWQATNSP
ncbi:hypothetical protein GOP47_0002657 [Adiantum capillus-veneris]|uniref:PPM-type phosphatase domain-containing protein n=1 Tax=Adiantum capillus-veneris TaxID=13818 RepID=A0A9D4ZPD4_ADICA|nr:hypothetical protein GOP47_0002657 [Adiantum capillus-veneris]